MSEPGTAGGATVGSLNVEVALQLGRLQADFDKMKGVVRKNAHETNQEFRRMAQEGGHAATSIRDQFGHAFDHIQRRAFNAGKFLHGILGGVGLGTGAAAVELVFHKIEHAIHAASERAKELEEHAEKMAEKFEQLSKSRHADFISTLAPPEKVRELTRGLEEVEHKIREVDAARRQALDDFSSLNKSGRGALTGSQVAIRFEGRLGDEGGGIANLADKALDNADKAQSKWLELEKERSELSKQRAETRKRIQEEETKRFEKIGDLQEKIATAERERAESLADKTPEEKLADLTKRVERLKYELSVATRFANQDAVKGDAKARIGDLEAQLDRTKRLADAEKELAGARKEVDRKGEEAAAERRRKFEEEEHLREQLQETVERERDRIMGNRKPNQGAGLLGQNSGVSPYHVEREQLSVLKRILETLQRKNGGAPVTDMLIGMGF